jgi:hypothetical protein
MPYHRTAKHLHTPEVRKAIPMRRTLLFITVLAVLVTFESLGKDTGTVVGIVTDPGGAVIQNASVTITNVATGLARTVTANGNGQYRADAFPTGPLTINAEQPGFQKLIRSGITLTAADVLTVNLELRDGNDQETV